uniref:Uncharacterized protein n=1 Tax=Oryza sativa subsp. japonica TaxID=39947 RepID=Q6Z5S7_ORYSJ|nr:hypothetical protein [Oryza sativa Japonica Group]
MAESAGEVGRRRGVVEGLTGANFRGESGGKGGGGGGDRFHALVGRGGAREPRRRGAKPAAMAAVGATGAGPEKDEATGVGIFNVIAWDATTQNVLKNNTWIFFGGGSNDQVTFI